MELERLITLIVRTIIEELGRQGLLRSEGITRPDVPPPVAVTAPTSLSAKQRVISAQVVLDTAKAGHRVLDIPANALITPLAADVAREKQVRFRREGER